MVKIIRKSLVRKRTADTSHDQHVLTLSDEQYDNFVQGLNEAPAFNTKLARLMSGKSPWEK
jgi:uncharacterized protein (DUF1778 family)